MIAILDYGIGNVGSILNMLKHIDVEAIITHDPDAIEAADKIILPGVGSFDSGMKKLADINLVDVIRKHVLQRNKHLLGICLGMQMLGRRSEEGVLPGLDLIPFDCIRFRLDSPTLKIPHMGWDVVKTEQSDPVVDNLIGLQRFYFVHSYHAVCDNPENVLFSCDYGYEFPAAVKHGNVYGFQFHPEKSHKFGMALLKNFASL
jgi:glutamine amidotransferase